MRQWCFVIKCTGYISDGVHVEVENGNQKSYLLAGNKVSIEINTTLLESKRGELYSSFVPGIIEFYNFWLNKANKLKQKTN